MVGSFKCAEPRPKKTDARTQFSSGSSDDRRGRTGTAVWIRSFKYAGVEEDMAAGRRMTAEDELEQLSGSGHSSTLTSMRTSF